MTTAARNDRDGVFSSAKARILRLLAVTLGWFAVLLLTVWAFAAIFVDCRMASLRLPLVALYVAIIVLGVLRLEGMWRKAGFCIGCFGIVLLWWLSLKPSVDGNWREDDARAAWAEIDGDHFTFHNVRNCDYHTETDYSNCWEDRTLDLSQLRAADFFFVNWGIRWIGHPIVSFDFGGNRHLAFSMEARYKKGQEYSAILGFFRQYELILIAADERDVVRLRTNFRKDEEVYMYRTAVSPEIARRLFLTYVAYLNRLHAQPEWYNALTKNCTTTIDKQIRSELPGGSPWTYRLLLNGALDQLEYERGRLVTGGLSFEDLKQREHINPYARTVGASPEFSALIRAGRVGF